MAMLCFNDMTTGQPILSTTSLEKAYGDFHAVKGVDLSVSRGEIFGLLGPNGAGKTTVIRMLVGLISASKGEVTYFGELGLRDMQQVLPRIGCIIEEPRFYPYLTGRKNLMLASLYYPKESVKNRIGEVLELVGLTARADDPVKNYSQGMRQRLGIAAAMLHNPELIILDEPTNGLDPQGIIELRQLIIRLKEEMGKTVILSSHILSEVEQMADSMAIIHQGKCVAQGRVSELLNEGNLQVTIETDDTQKAVDTLKAAGFSILSNDAHTVLLLASRKELPRLSKILVEGGHPLYRLEHRRKLEDYFLKLTTA
jgi:ABC-type multidrug transport system ATPase subunit